MLTVDALRRLGVNTDEGLARCLNNEAFYIRLVNMALDDAGFEKLSSAGLSYSKPNRRLPFSAAATAISSAVLCLI